MQHIDPSHTILEAARHRFIIDFYSACIGSYQPGGIFYRERPLGINQWATSTKFINGD